MKYSEKTKFTVLTDGGVWRDRGTDSAEEPCVFRKVRASTTESESSCSDLGDISESEAKSLGGEEKTESVKRS